MSELGRVLRVSPVQTAVRNCTRDEGRSFEICSQVLVSKPLQAAVVKSDGGERCSQRWDQSQRVRLREASASEPSMKCRKRIRRCQNRGVTLVWGFVCQGDSAMQRMFCRSSVSLFDLKARFFIPTRSSARPSRAEAVRVGRRTNLSTCFALARPYLDSFEHDSTLGAVG